MNLYDAHNHLQDERLKSVRADAVRRLRIAGLKNMVVNGTQEKDWLDVLTLAREHSQIIPAIGLHPWFIAQRSGDWQKKLVRLLDEQPGCGVGEIGLDRWIEGFDPKLQEEIFVYQLRLADERNLPVSIHCLRAWGPLLEVLRREWRTGRGFLLHSYGGSAELIKPLTDLGGYFSISGYFAQERKVKAREIFKEVPLDRLLVETDAPDMLPPQPLIAEALNGPDGERANHPVNLPNIYQFAADLRGLPLATFAGRMEQNFKRLFGSAA